MSIHVITIDGPSGSGKGTLASKIAQHYGYYLLDSGALYRLLGLSLKNKGLLTSLDTRLTTCVDCALNLDIQFKSNTEDSSIQILLEGEDVSSIIRTEEVGAYASQIATIPELRAALLQRQHDFAQAPGLVADGRDMGTVVFPNAAAKIYLTASAQSRAERRVKQLQAIGLDAKIDAILANIEDRDRRDMERSVAPLKPAEDAYVIDSSSLNIDQVFQAMVEYIDSKLA
ncbi:(d)CMP kinase [Acinetobacter sp. MD2(2019)]|uniref:(d)CMP kinase n=1 Tax=Acinetobacter sp. MD2(2019) TaxID=2605273 RepID=UPI002D1F09F5|nr:(d)CMP kinase [Acinetobacter sp. MD2(2019)]MEB3752823.1 (d)CMP kinase [Acinetobacter sp. MD2(2019)]